MLSTRSVTIGALAVHTTIHNQIRHDVAARVWRRSLCKCHQSIKKRIRQRQRWHLTIKRKLLMQTRKARAIRIKILTM